MKKKSMLRASSRYEPVDTNIRKIKVNSIKNIKKAAIGFFALFLFKKAHFNPIKIILTIRKEGRGNFILRLKKIAKSIAEYKSVLYVWEKSKIKDFNVYLAECSEYDTAKNTSIDALKLNVVGLEYYEEEKKKGSRIIFIDWHHGHFFLAKDYLFKLEPMLVSYGPLECYSKKNDVFVVERFSNSVQMLSRMLKHLDEKRPLHYLFDGIMGVRTRAYNLFDKKIYLPNALSKFIKNADVVIIPINAYLKNESELNIYIGKGMRHSIGLQAASDENIINSFLELFENNILINAPAMVNYSYLGFIEGPAVRDNYA